MTVFFDDGNVTGTSIGIADDGSYGRAFNQAFRADVTASYRAGDPSHDYFFREPFHRAVTQLPGFR